MPAKFKVGDRVRILNPVLESDQGVFTIVRVHSTTIGYPCMLRDCYGNLHGYSIPEDQLVLVKKTSESTSDRRIRELEERVTELEVRLGIRLR